MLPPASRVSVVALLVIATLVLVQPGGVFLHFVDDHLGEHSRTAHDGLTVHLADGDAPDHDADHCHMWMTPANAAVMPRVQGRMRLRSSLCSSLSHALRLLCSL